jgi:hypothetical protein
MLSVVVVVESATRRNGEGSTPRHGVAIEKSLHSDRDKTEEIQKISEADIASRHYYHYIVCASSPPRPSRTANILSRLHLAGISPAKV